LALRDRLRSRLALRIYLVGLLQIAIVAAGFIAFVELNRPSRSRTPDADERLVAERVAGLLDDREALLQELERARDELSLAVTVTAPDGDIIATTSEPDTPPCGPPPRHRRGRRPPPGWGRPRPHDGSPPPLCRTTVLRFPDGQYGRLELRRLKPPPPPSPFELPVIAFVLVVVAVSSWLLARSLVRPLQQLSSAARALGAGELATRAGIDRGDELGDVARAFDEMAEHVGDLLRAEKELVANVSHELRTPLARIRVALDLAAEGDAEVARASLADIAGDLEELERLVADVLTAARLDLSGASRGVPPLRRESVDVAELVAQAASRFESAHPERPLEREVAADLPSVDGDPVLLRRALDNLLDNAHNGSREPTDPVTLRAQIDGGDVLVEIIDRGIGIDEDDLARVFRPFFRADKSRARQTGGLGLGLALVKRIAEAHGGSIELDSRPGEGTRARLRLSAG
jgi:signal transduction histidine kinase